MPEGHVDPVDPAAARPGPLVTRHATAPAHVRDALRSWLPGAEVAVSLLDGADAVVAVADEDGATVAVALELFGVPTLSGAAAVAACAGGTAGTDDLVAALRPVVDRVAPLEVVGPRGLALPVATGLARASGAPLSLVMEQRLLAVADPAEVVAPSGIAGRARRLAPGDRATVARWLDDFAVEAIGDRRRGADFWLERMDDGWGLWVWAVAGAPVAVVNGRPTTPVSARIGPVYTPPDRRGNGYATALVAHVATTLLAEGHERVVLYADVANPTSGALYARVGFADVGPHGSWLVGAAEADAGADAGEDAGEDADPAPGGV